MSSDGTKNLINEYTKNKWQRIWNTQNTKLNAIKRDIHRWVNPKTSRKEETLDRLHIGHTKINSRFLDGSERSLPFSNLRNYVKRQTHNGWLFDVQSRTGRAQDMAQPGLRIWSQSWKKLRHNCSIKYKKK